MDTVLHIVQNLLAIRQVTPVLVFSLGTILAVLIQEAKRVSFLNDWIELIGPRKLILIILGAYFVQNNLNGYDLESIINTININTTAATLVGTLIANLVHQIGYKDLFNS